MRKSNSWERATVGCVLILVLCFDSEVDCCCYNVIDTLMLILWCWYCVVCCWCNVVTVLLILCSWCSVTWYCCWYCVVGAVLHDIVVDTVLLVQHYMILLSSSWFYRIEITVPPPPLTYVKMNNRTCRVCSVVW